MTRSVDSAAGEAATTYVVAVAAPIGGGKSSLVQGLATALNNAATLHFDDYELATRQSPAELARWLAQGADFNGLHAPGFAAAVSALRRGEVVIDPASGQPIRPGAFVVLEMPLGRAFAETSAMIDFLVWVETPLDLALARNLRSLTADAIADQGDPRQFLRWLDSYLGQYMDQVRLILQLQKTRVAPAADLVLDGTQPPAALIADAARMIVESRGKAGREGRAPAAPA